ncbi:MAG: VWA domain-containing protein [Planctomycetes bacterium]|nr:VWA domain-containing protein [Planctomycetota bacterium]
MTFLTMLDPWLLPLALCAIVALLPALDRRRHAPLQYSSLAIAAPLTRSWALRMRWLPAALRASAILMLGLCLARPVIANQQTKTFVEGAAIEIVIDRSSSMRALDFSVGGSASDRLEAVKAVATSFIAGGMGLEGRPNDLIGVTCFARFADSLSPLTLDHSYVVDVLRQLEPAGERAEDGTAIGDAVALAVERLRDAMKNAPKDGGRQPIESAAIVLLTDGENNAGDVDPRIAADLAKTYGIKIYAVGVGSKGSAPFPVGTDPFGQTIIRNVAVNIDEDLLKDMAARTGGEYFRATDTQSLRAIYSQIDAMEKTKTEQRRSMLYTDLAVQPGSWRGWSMPPLLAIAALLLAAEILLTNTRLRVLN